MRAPTPAVAALVRANVAHRVHRYEHDPSASSYGQEAVAALGVDTARVFKTLVGSIGGRLVVAVVPMSAELDMKALATAFDAKSAAMAEPAAAEKATGYVVGGISPVGQKRSLPTVIDVSASDWETVFVSGGRRGLEVEVSPTDLVALTGGRLVAIAKER